MPKVLRVDARRPSAVALAEAARALARGALVVMPTETVYGLAGDTRLPGVVEKIYAAKGRPESKPLVLLAADKAAVKRAGAVFSAAADRLARRFWPGPLTLVLPAGNGELGFRVPDHPVARALLRQAGGWLAVTSANRSGCPPATTAREVADGLGRSVTVILDAGPSPGGVPSTVVRVVGRKPEILRAGAVPAEAVRRWAREAR